MIFIGVVFSVLAVGFGCWLLFNLAVYALPLFAGAAIGTLAHNTGASWSGAMIIGLVATGLTFGIGKVLLGVARPTWARLVFVLIFTTPAAVAGYYATLGVVKVIVPSEPWQILFSLFGAVAIAATAFMRFVGMAVARRVAPG